jgi:hypothetical protein
MIEEPRVAAEPDGRRVVDQRVEPDVHDAVGIPRQRDPPRLTGARHRDVDETALDQPQNLVAANLRLQELGMRREVIEQRLLVFRQAEEVVLLADPLRLERRVQGAVAADEILLLLELLAADAVPPFVHPFVDVAGVPDALCQMRHADAMPRLRGADEVVE